MDMQADDSQAIWDSQWPCTEALKILTELNEQCLELLTEQALTRAPHAPPIFRELADLWGQLNVASRRRAAACPFLLVDAGFSDPYHWKWMGGSQITDGEPAHYSHFFSAAAAARVAHQAFTNAWYLVRTQPAGAGLYLGMSDYCAGLLRSYTVRQVTELAHQQAGRLRPRWAGRVRVWRELLAAAISGEGLALEMARLHGVQLLAMELKALEQVNTTQRCV
jgi:hypothetical protein